MVLPQRRVGDRSVSAVGLGCMPLSFEEMVDERERALATIHRALDLGITLIDTANVYAPAWEQIGHNERLVAEALRTYTGPADLAGVLVATKGGAARGPGEAWGRDSTRDGLRRAAEESLTALGAPVIDLYQHHRHDPAISYVDQLEALRALVDDGLVARLGLSNVNARELAVALDVLGGPSDGGIVSVQNEFSPRYRGDADVIGACTEAGLAFLPWSPLGGASQAHDVGSRYAAFAEVGEQVGASAQEVVIAWLLGLAPVVVVIPGATRPATVESIVHALDVDLTADQRAALDATTPEATSMYPDDSPRSPLPSDGDA